MLQRTVGIFSLLDLCIALRNLGHLLLIFFVKLLKFKFVQLEVEGAICQSLGALLKLALSVCTLESFEFLLLL